MFVRGNQHIATIISPELSEFLMDVLAGRTPFNAAGSLCQGPGGEDKASTLRGTWREAAAPLQGTSGKP
jgi:hypothetical protein